jgi:hypothetical protein
MKGTWETTEGGGGGPGTVVLVIVAAALLGPAVAAAVAELLHVLVIVAGVIAGVGATGLVSVLAWRWRHPRPAAARTTPPLPSRVVRAAPQLPPERQAPQLPAAPGRELPGGLHLHFHGVEAADVAAVIARHHEGRG